MSCHSYYYYRLHYFIKFTENILYHDTRVAILSPNQSRCRKGGRVRDVEEQMRDEFGTRALSISALATGPKKISRGYTVLYIGYYIYKNELLL